MNDLDANVPESLEHQAERRPGSNRVRLREHVRRLLVEQMLTGKLEPGDRIKESRLAEQFDISRTPLREALVKLESEGLVTSEPGKGATVAALEPSRGIELYELVAWLETSALLKSPVPDDEVLEALARYDGQRNEDDGIHRGIQLDTAWHNTLLAQCENQELVETVADLRLRLYRYVYWTHTSDQQREVSVVQHSAIRTALEQGDVATATQRLREHWDHGRRELEDNAEYLARRFSTQD